MISKIKKISNKNIVYLNIITLMLLQIFMFFIVKNEYKRNEVIINTSIWTTLMFIICYVHNTFLLKKFLIENKKTLLYVIIIPFFVLIASIIMYNSAHYINSHLVYIPEDGNDTFVSNIIMVVFWLPISSAFYLAMRSFIERSEKKAIETEKLKTEIDFLKSQINPHFFFNTLNNLYGLTLEKSSKAPEMILQLSDLMHYNIYDSSADKIFLVKEIKSIENYIELKKICLENFKYTLNTEISDENIKIAPKILINFIENSFKHGVERNVKNSFIDISIKSNSNEIKFVVKNNFPIEDSHKISSGIGLENVKKQLTLLYPEKHIIQTNVENDIYAVELIINTNNNE